MILKTLPNEENSVVAAGFPSRPSQYARFEGLEKSGIAELRATTINNMTCDELVRMIRVAGLPYQLCAKLDEYLPLYDHKTLTRLAHLALRCCCNHGQGSIGKDAE